MKAFLITIAVIGGIFALSIAGIALKAVFFPVSTVGTLVDTAYDVKDKTLSADNVIYNYEWFKQRYENIKATENKVRIAEEQVKGFQASAGPREKWTFEDKTEHARLNEVHRGLRNHLEDLVAEYNARSKMANRNLFQGGLIPSALEIGSNLLK